MKFINKIQRFMYGRYGTDELNKFLIITYLIIFILNMFFNIILVTVLELVLFCIIMFRLLSKNRVKRMHENQIYSKFKRKLSNPINNIKMIWRDRKNFLYKKCNKCKTILKLPLPNKIGFNHAKCPECGKRLTIFSLRKQKIKIIRKGR